MANGGPFPVRGYHPGDRNRILRDWTSINRKSAPFRWMERDVYDVHDCKIKTILPFCDIFISHDPEMPSVIYGWAVTSRDARVLHMVFVRRGEFRRIGVASSLLRAAFGKLSNIKYTHHTNLIKKYGLDEKWGLSVFNPYIVDDMCEALREMP